MTDPHELATRVRALRDEADAAQERARAATQEAVIELIAQGVTRREIGALLGISHQRVTQLAQTHETAPTSRS